MSTDAKRAELGSVSTGTMRPEDLIPAFLDVLSDLDGARAVEFQQELDADSWDWDSEDASEVLSELFYALDDHAPPYCYFGAHLGDGADYGYWPSWDAIESVALDGVVVKVQAGDELPLSDHPDAEYFVACNDHGNATLCDRTGQEIWSAV